MSNEKEKSKVTYSDLSTALKVLVVLCWIWVGINVIAFTIGFIAGMLGL